MKQANPKRILVTDRNPRVRRLLCRELEREGFRALAASGWNDIELAVAHAGVDCVIMDMDMPHQGGQGPYAFLEQLKRQAPRVLVVAHAFSSEEAAEIVGLRLAVAVVEKSGDTEPLKAAVREILNPGQSRRVAS